LSEALQDSKGTTPPDKNSDLKTERSKNDCTTNSALKDSNFGIFDLGMNQHMLDGRTVRPLYPSRPNIPDEEGQER